MVMYRWIYVKLSHFKWCCSVLRESVRQVVNSMSRKLCQLTFFMSFMQLASEKLAQEALVSCNLHLWMWYGLDARTWSRLKYCSHQNYEMGDVSGMWCVYQTWRLLCCWDMLLCGSIELFGVNRSMLLQDRYGQDNVSVVIVDFG